MERTRFGCTGNVRVLDTTIDLTDSFCSGLWEDNSIVRSLLVPMLLWSLIADVVIPL